MVITEITPPSLLLGAQLKILGGRERERERKTGAILGAMHTTGAPLRGAAAVFPEHGKEGGGGGGRTTAHQREEGEGADGRTDFGGGGDGGGGGGGGEGGRRTTIFLFSSPPPLLTAVAFGLEACTLPACVCVCVCPPRDSSGWRRWGRW